MSKGTPIRTFRLPPELEAEIYRTILRRNTWTRNEPWTFASFIIEAIRTKLRDMDRSRRQGGKKKPRPQQIEGKQ